MPFPQKKHLDGVSRWEHSRSLGITSVGPVGWQMLPGGSLGSGRRWSCEPAPRTPRSGGWSPWCHHGVGPRHATWEWPAKGFRLPMWHGKVQQNKPKKVQIFLMNNFFRPLHGLQNYKSPHKIILFFNESSRFSASLECGDERVQMWHGPRRSTAPACAKPLADQPIGVPC